MLEEDVKNQFRYSLCESGIATLTMNMAGTVNTINHQFVEGMHVCLDNIVAERELRGLIICSEKTTFLAGGDLHYISSVERDSVGPFIDWVRRLRHLMRRIEELRVPVVAAVSGAALGGGYEFCLACNRRIAVDSPEVYVGLPEIGLGLIPCGGGIVRLTKLVGLAAAIPILTENRRYRVSEAVEIGLADQSVSEPEELIDAARAWIKADSSSSVQPWDKKGFKIPGGGLRSKEVSGPSWRKLKNYSDSF